MTIVFFLDLSQNLPRVQSASALRSAQTDLALKYFCGAKQFFNLKTTLSVDFDGMFLKSEPLKVSE